MYLLSALGCITAYHRASPRITADHRLPCLLAWALSSSADGHCSPPPGPNPPELPANCSLDILLEIYVLYYRLLQFLYHAEASLETTSLGVAA